MRSFVMFVVVAGVLGCGVTGSVVAQEKKETGKFISPKEASAFWQKSKDEAARRTAFEWLQSTALTCAAKDLPDALRCFGLIATEAGAHDAFLAVCAKRSSPQVDMAVRQTVALQLADWQSEAGNFEAAVSALTAHINIPELSPALRSFAARKAALILADNLGRPADAASLLATAIAAAPAERDPGSYAEMANARAALLHSQLHDGAGAEAETRRVLALGDNCPLISYSAAADQLVSLLAESGRTNDSMFALLLVFRHASLPAVGCARKLIDIGAPPAQLEEAVGLLRGRMTTAFATSAEWQLRIERVQPEIVELLLALGRPEEAVRECRAYALSASDKSYPQAIELAARCLKSLDGNLGRANALLEFHSSAPPPAGTSNPLIDFPALEDPVRSAAARLTEKAPSDWSGWINRSVLLAWLDRPADSMDAARAAFASCPMTSNSLQVCANAVARPVLIATRDPVFSQRLSDFLLVGSVGPDGRQGTEDDIADPFPEARRRLTYSVKSAVPALSQVK